MDTQSQIFPSEIQKSINTYMPFLLEIRKRLFFTVCLFVITAVIGFIYTDKIIRLVVETFGIKGVNIVFTSPFQFINLSLTISFMVGVVILLPVIIIQTISFLKPALKNNEYRLMLSLLPISILLFIGGFSFGVIVMRYIVAAFYLQSIKLNIGNFLDVSNLISHILTVAVLMGLAFQFPILITALMRLKIIKHNTLARKRFWVYAGAAMLAALLPPADIPSTVVYFLILVVLFETTLLLNRWIGKTHLL